MVNTTIYIKKAGDNAARRALIKQQAGAAWLPARAAPGAERCVQCLTPAPLTSRIPAACHARQGPPPGISQLLLMSKDVIFDPN